MCTHGTQSHTQCSILQVLGKDGYNPSGLMASINADQEKADRADRAAAASAHAATSGSTTSEKLPAAVGATGAAAVDAAIASISKYKVGGDGAKCLTLLDLFLKNVVEKPLEDKYRSINTESGAFKGKVAGLAGGIGLLKAVKEWRKYKKMASVFLRVDDLRPRAGACGALRLSRESAGALAHGRSAF